MSLITLPNSIISGDADNPTRDMANWTTIRDIINGNLDNTNISASAAIAISKTALGTFTDWTAWTATLTGFSGTPTQVNRYCRIGNVVFAEVNISGTSNATGFTFTLPVACATANALMGFRVFTNGSAVAGSGMVDLAVSSTATVYLDGASAGFATANLKAINGNFFYEVA